LETEDIFKVVQHYFEQNLESRDFFTADTSSRCIIQVRCIHQVAVLFSCNVIDFWLLLV